jgi:peptidoglycan hydrolase FlgJ
VTTPPVAPSAIDLTGLDDLRRRAGRDDPAALAEAAVQFEALFIGMMLDSARSANFGGGLLDGPETDQYLELMDRQVALDMARHGGLGFGKMLLQQLAPGATPHLSSPPAPLGAPAALTGAPAPVNDAAPQPATATEPTAAVPAAEAAGAEFPTGLPAGTTTLGGAEAADAGASTADDFVARLLPEANAAASALGVEPRLLLAQAALETGWGAAVPQRGDGASAHNLFGIKAGAAWRGQRIAQWTLEHENGSAVRRRADFRAYPSAAASFTDYVNLVSSTPRYAGALANAGDPEAYARALGAAGYATDPAYADKWLAIYRGGRLDGALRSAELAADGIVASSNDTGL